MITPIFTSGLCYKTGMTREDLAEQLSILLHFYSAKSGLIDFKEGSSKEPDDYDVIIDLGWAVKVDDGGPWRRITITPEGEEMVEQILRATRVDLTL